MLKKYWKRLKYWQKGSTIGVLMGIILPVTFFITSEQLNVLPDLILKIYYIPHFISEIIWENAGCGWCLMQFVISEVVLGLIQLTLLGMIIGLIMDKFRKESTPSNPKK